MWKSLAVCKFGYLCVILHADSLGGDIRPEEKFLREVVVERDDALLSVDEKVVVAGVQAQFTQVVSVGKQQKRLITSTHAATTLTH